MKKLVREIPLTNGLTVRFYDASRRYFGDYHQVRVEMVCDVPVAEDLFHDAEEYRKAVKLLGSEVRYQRHAEHMGVPSDQLDHVVGRVVEQFCGHSLRYFSGADFPRRLVHSELERVKKRTHRFVAGRFHG